jgi:hypothetical protein
MSEDLSQWMQKISGQLEDSRKEMAEFHQRVETRFDKIDNRLLVMKERISNIDEGVTLIQEDVSAILRAVVPDFRTGKTVNDEISDIKNRLNDLENSKD